MIKKLFEKKNQLFVQILMVPTKTHLLEVINLLFPA